jgi:hypothetical protein
MNCFSSVILLLAFASYFISDCPWSAFFTSKRHKPSHHVKVTVLGEGTIILRMANNFIDIRTGYSPGRKCIQIITVTLVFWKCWGVQWTMKSAHVWYRATEQI